MYIEYIHSHSHVINIHIHLEVHRLSPSRNFLYCLRTGDGSIAYSRCSKPVNLHEYIIANIIGWFSAILYRLVVSYHCICNCTIHDIYLLYIHMTKWSISIQLPGEHFGHDFLPSRPLALRRGAPELELDFRESLTVSSWLVNLPLGNRETNGFQ